MRKVSQNSLYNARKRANERMYGELFNEGKEWDDDMIDSLLEAFLVKECRYISNRESFMSLCGRSRDAITNHLWKVFSRYERKSVEKYEPGKRTQREGTPFTARDHAVMEKATSTLGIKNNAFAPEYLSKILARSPESIKAEYHRLISTRGFFKVPPGEDGSGNSLAKSVNVRVRGTLSRVMKEIGL